MIFFCPKSHGHFNINYSQFYIHLIIPLVFSIDVVVKMQSTQDCPVKINYCINILTTIAVKEFSDLSNILTYSSCQDMNRLTFLVQTG